MIDSCVLGGVDNSEEEESKIHSQFVGFGLEKASNKLPEIIEPNSIVVGFSVGGAIAYKTALISDKISSLYCISASRLRKEEEKPSCNLSVFIGSKDEYQPKQDWFDKMEIKANVIEGNHHIYYNDGFSRDLCLSIIKSELPYFLHESDRLQYRGLERSDIPVWRKFFDNNDSLHFLGIDMSKNFDQHAKDWIEKQQERYLNDGLGHLAVIKKESGEMIGMGGLLKREINDKIEYEVAYSLMPDEWGKGYGTEIAKHIKQFGQENDVKDGFISIIHVDNQSSMNVARKNGMHELYESEYLGMPVIVFGD